MKKLIFTIGFLSCFSFSAFGQGYYDGLPGPKNNTAVGSLSGKDGSGVNVTATGGNTAQTEADRAAQKFNISDYGAKCDGGTTNDNTAVNATLSVAGNSSAYQNNNMITIIGPNGITQQGCKINSLNATGFTKGTGANVRPQVNIEYMTLLCTGAGNVCLDGFASDFIKMNHVSIRGDVSPNSPEICIQFGVVNATSSAWHHLDHVNCNNEFTLTALYNFGSEANTYEDSFFVNAHTSSGPIGNIGAITGGSSYTNGTYTNVAMTGGVGSGALAKVVVSGGAVSAVTITYEGRDYAPSDVLSAAAASIGGTGSGFSIPVSTVTPYAAIIDGQNHWRASSAFVTETLSVETWQSQTLDTFRSSHIRQLGSGGGLWIAWGGGVQLADNSYILNNSGATCMTIFDNGVTKGGIPGPNWGSDLSFNCEGSAITSMINFTGSNNTPNIQDFRYRGYHLATGSTFSLASNITSMTMNNADIDMKFAPNSGTPMFSIGQAKLWKMSGQIAAPNPLYWNAPSTFQGRLVLGLQATPPGIGPIDIMGSAALAISCDQQLSSLYFGPLCQVQRADNSAVLDEYPDGFGNLDRSAHQAFCAGTTCGVKIAYNQNGDGNNCTQATIASQPILTLGVAAFGGRSGMLFGDQSAFALSCPAATSINDLWATGGYASIVMAITGNANQADRVMYKTNGALAGVGWELRMNFVGSSYTFIQSDVTGGGQWSTPAFGNVGMVVDLQYNNSSLSNVPVVGFQGTNQTITVTSQPIGIIPTDAALPLLIGNNAATAGNRGLPGYIGSIMLWKATPTATQAEVIRRNAAARYNIAGVN